MRIGMKLILGFISVAVISAVVGVIGIINIGSINDSDTRMYEKMVVPLGELNNITMGSQRLRINIRDYAETKDPARRAKAKEKIEEIQKNLVTLNESFVKTLIKENTKQMFRKFEASLKDYEGVCKKVMDLTDSGKENEAGNLLRGEGAEKAQEVRADLEELARFKMAAAKETAQGNSALASRASVLMTSAIAIGVLLAIGLGVFLTISITRPLAAGVTFAQKVAGGDLTATVDVQSKDELGILARALNETVSRLKESMTQISEASSQVKSASEQIAQGNQDLSARTEQQAAAVEETAASMEEMATSIKSNTQNAQEVNNLAIDAANKAGAGVGVVGDVVTAMTGITESSQKIGQIIEVMNNIAFQTNLLALNASIEAARAGEQGRGFAVVAVEVRKLAQRSEEASREITQLIGESNTRVGTGASLVKKAGTSLDDINAAVGKVKNLVAEISAASQEQLTGVDQINKTIISLDQNTQQNSSLVEESASAAEELSGQSQELFAIVSQFKIGDASGRVTAKEKETKKIGHTPVFHGPTVVQKDPQNAHIAKGEVKSMTVHAEDRKKEGFVEF